MMMTMDSYDSSNQCNNNLSYGIDLNILQDNTNNHHLHHYQQQQQQQQQKQQQQQRKQHRQDQPIFDDSQQRQSFQQQNQHNLSNQSSPQSLATSSFTASAVSAAAAAVAVATSPSVISLFKLKNFLYHPKFQNLLKSGEVVNPISINGPNIDDQVVIDENSPPSQPPPSTLSSSSSYESTSSTQRNPTISSASTSYRNISPLFSSTNPFQANLGRQLMTNNNAHHHHNDPNQPHQNNLGLVDGLASTANQLNQSTSSLSSTSSFSLSPPPSSSSSTTTATTTASVGQILNSLAQPFRLTNNNQSSHTSTINHHNHLSSISNGSGRKYQCKMCPQIFYSKADMQLHTQIHMRESKPYKCSQCTKSFANSSYLSQHSRIHLGIKPYRCEMCQRKFTQLSHLQQHYRTHTGDKPYRCRFANCTKSFSQLSNLQSHSRSHQTDKPYKCNSCYKCFVDEAGLLEHIPKHKDSKHLKTHICQFCGKSYTQETYLSKHMQKHTDRNENKHQTHHHQQHHLQNHNQLQSSTSRNNQSSSGNVGVQTPMLGDNSGGYNLSKASNLNRSTSTSSSTSIDCSNLIISSSMPGLNAATSVASHSLNNLINNQPHLFLDQSQNFEQLQSSNQNLRNGDDALLYGVNQHQRISIDKNSIETIVSKSHIPVTLSPSSVPTISAAMPNVRSMPYAFPYDAFNFHQKLSSNPGLLLNDVNANFLSSNSRKLSNFNDPSVMPSSTSISSSSTSPTSSMIATKTGPTALPNQLIALNQIRSYASLPVAVGQTIINNDHLQQHQTNLNHRHQQQSISLKED